MGHYVPQEYLSYFAPSSATEKVWMFDKDTDLFNLLPIKIVAQSLTSTVGRMRIG